jgi:hypothetical protein
MKSPDKIANKLRDYFKQQELESIRKREREQENEISRKEMLRVNIPMTPFSADSNAIRIPNVPLDGRIHGPSSKVETLDLTDYCLIFFSATVLWFQLFYGLRIHLCTFLHLFETLVDKPHVCCTYSPALSHLNLLMKNFHRYMA